MLRAYKIVSTRMSYELEEVYQQFQPDAVVCTMSFAAQIATAIYERGVCRAPRMGIVTDYTLHPFWVGTNLDMLVSPSEQLTESFVAKGIDPRIIKPVGIPISLDFAKHIDRQAACDELGIENMPTLLLMGGSMGHGDIAKAIESMDKSASPFQILAVCGSNVAMQHRLEKMQTRKPMRVYGFTDNIHVMMSASDMIVTKPGGLTVSEAVAKKLPMVLINPIPGQEDRNMDFLTNHGMAMRANATLPVGEVVGQLMLSQARRRLMSQAQEAFGKPNATLDVWPASGGDGGGTGVTTPGAWNIPAAPWSFSAGARPPLVLVVCSQRGGLGLPQWTDEKGRVRPTDGPAGNPRGDRRAAPLLEETGARAAPLRPAHGRAQAGGLFPGRGQRPAPPPAGRD